MTRSVLQPIRTRRTFRHAQPSAAKDAAGKDSKLTPATRKTLAAIGALWISFAASASASAGVDPAKAAPAPAAAEPAVPTVVAVEPRGRQASAPPLQSTTSMRSSAPASVSAANESEGVVFLTTGKRQPGPRSRPSTPEIRHPKADATAVVAYLKSLSK